MTLVVNHLKSKGCGGETGGDVDSGDGQGCFNATRTAAAEALVDWMATHPTGVDDDDFLVMGDMNSYAKEDPITALVTAGFVDLASLQPDPYSYVFDGQWGYLDYAARVAFARRPGHRDGRVPHQRRRGPDPRLQHRLQERRPDREPVRSRPVPHVGPRPGRRRPPPRRQRRCRGRGRADPPVAAKPHAART